MVSAICARRSKSKPLSAHNHSTYYYIVFVSMCVCVCYLRRCVRRVTMRELLHHTFVCVRVQSQSYYFGVLYLNSDVTTRSMCEW